MFYLWTSGITIEGFTINGYNSALPNSGINVGGVDVNAGEGIASYQGIGTITVENNVIENFSYTGVDFYNYNNNSGATTDNTISDNDITNIGYDGYLTSNPGVGVLLYSNFYAAVTGNVISGLLIGVQTGGFSQANPDSTFSPVISGNQVTSAFSGVFYNQYSSGASSFTISGNTLTAANQSAAESGSFAPYSPEWDGIEISSLADPVSVTVAGNTISAAATITAETTVGYQIWNDPTTSTITLNGGSVTGADYGVWVDNFDGGDASAGSTAVIVNGVSVSNAADAGIYVQDDPRNTTSPSNISATITGGTTVTGSAVGILVSGTNASATITGDTISGNTTGIMVDTPGSAAITGGTIIQNNSNGSGSGGGIDNAGTLTLMNSILSGNLASSDGGGIYNTGTLTVTNSTVANNSAVLGGGIDNTGTLTIVNSTIAYNNTTSGSGGGGGLDASGGTSTLNNTIVALNTDGTGRGKTADDIAGTYPRAARIT